LVAVPNELSLYRGEQILGSSLDRLDLGEWELPGDQVDDGDHLGLGSIAARPALGRLDERVAAGCCGPREIQGQSSRVNPGRAHRTALSVE